jgi:hypothetical protein
MRNPVIWPVIPCPISTMEAPTSPMMINQATSLDVGGMLNHDITKLDDVATKPIAMRRTQRRIL